jgi:hypothetical protein
MSLICLLPAPLLELELTLLLPLPLVTVLSYFFDDETDDTSFEVIKEANLENSRDFGVLEVAATRVPLGAAAIAFK